MIPTPTKCLISEKEKKEIVSIVSALKNIADDNRRIKYEVYRACHALERILIYLQKEEKPDTHLIENIKHFVTEKQEKSKDLENYNLLKVSYNWINIVKDSAFEVVYLHVPLIDQIKAALPEKYRADRRILSNIKKYFSDFQATYKSLELFNIYNEIDDCSAAIEFLDMVIRLSEFSVESSKKSINSNEPVRIQNSPYQAMADVGRAIKNSPSLLQSIVHKNVKTKKLLEKYKNIMDDKTALQEERNKMDKKQSKLVKKIKECSERLKVCEFAHKEEENALNYMFKIPQIKEAFSQIAQETLSKKRDIFRKIFSSSEHYRQSNLLQHYVFCNFNKISIENYPYIPLIRGS